MVLLLLLVLPLRVPAGKAVRVRMDLRRTTATAMRPSPSRTIM